ncbi:MAG: HPr kinase [Thalassobaculales bacterium]
MTRDYALYGLRLRSALPLPGAPPWAGPPDRPADATIVVGPVPARLEAAVHSGPLLQVDAAGRVRHEVRGIAAFLVEGGRQITVAPAAGTAEGEVRLFLLATPLGVLFHQRGLLPLHASTVAIGGQAVALAGPSAAGKSTLAAALLAAGGQLLADDLTVVDPAAPGGPLVLPGMPQQKLWRDSLEALGIAADEQVRPGTAMEKFVRRVPDAFAAAPCRLAAVCHLGGGPADGAPRLTALTGARAVHGLREQVYRLHAARAMALDDRLLLHCARLAGQVPQFRLERGGGLPALAGLARAVIGALAGTAAGALR